MRVFVLDASALLAALGGSPNAAPALLLRGVHDGDFHAVACPHLIDEVRDGLQKPYFRAKLTKAQAEEAIDAYSAVALMEPDPIAIQAILRDPDDDYLVTLARTAKADAIVTGDKDLLEHPGLQPRAITPREACELLQLSKPRS